MAQLPKGGLVRSMINKYMSCVILLSRWYNYRCLFNDSFYVSIDFAQLGSHHLGCKRPWYLLRYLPYQVVSRISEPSTLEICGFRHFLHPLWVPPRTIDSEKLARTVDKAWQAAYPERSLGVMVQVNSSGEESKHLGPKHVKLRGSVFLPPQKKNRGMEGKKERIQKKILGMTLCLYMAYGVCFF